MGERLVVNVFDNDPNNPVANVYYQWSGYSDCCSEELINLIEGIHACEVHVPTGKPVGLVGGSSRGRRLVI